MKNTLIIILTAILLVGCSNGTFDKAMEQGKLALANGEYDKALASFELALNEKPKDEEAKGNYDNISSFLNIQKKIGDGAILEAKEDVEKLLQKSTLNNMIKTELEKMKKEIVVAEENKGKVEQKIEEANKLVSEKKYTEAKSIVDDIQKNESLKNVISHYNEEILKITKTIDSAVAQQKQEEESKKKREEVLAAKRNEFLKKLADIEASLVDLDYLYKNGITSEMKEAESETYKRWDNALNEIYGYLKTQLSASEMNDLREKQKYWISYRDKTAKNESSAFEGGTMEGLQYVSTLARVTKERCYELVKGYM